MKLWCCTQIYVRKQFVCCVSVVVRVNCVAMTFEQNLSKIIKVLLLFGISPYFFNEKSKKFECSKCASLYTLFYFLMNFLAITYLTVVHFSYGGDVFSILALLKNATVTITFCSVMLDLVLNCQKYANYLNSLIQLDTKLGKLINVNCHTTHLMPMQIGVIVCFFLTGFLLDLIIYRDEMEKFQHAWNVTCFFQGISITLMACYVRCLAIILHRRSVGIIDRLDSIGHDLQFPVGINEQKVSERIRACVDAFDDLMTLKNQLSDIFGVQLFLMSTFDFIILTISVYCLLYFFHYQNFQLLFYWFAFNVPHAIKCVLVVSALDKLANQVRKKTHFLL